MMIKKVLIAGTVLGTLTLGLSPVIAGAASKSKTFVIDATGQGISGGMGLRTSGYAKGTITVNTATNQVCYRIRDKGLGTVQLAHIHAGKKGVDGGVVVTLNVKAFNSKKKAATCVKVRAPIVRSMFKSPGLYYFNVHTAAFPNGAVRAQL